MKRTLVVDVSSPIKIFPDGDSWCALCGGNIQEGVCAFGDTPIEAIAQLHILFQPKNLSLEGVEGDNQWTVSE